MIEFKKEGFWSLGGLREIRARRQAKLKEVYQELKRRMHDAISEQDAYLRVPYATPYA